MGARYLPEQQLEGKSQVSWKAVKTLNLILSFWWTSESNHFCRTHDEFLLFYITINIRATWISVFITVTWNKVDSWRKNKHAFHDEGLVHVTMSIFNKVRPRAIDILTELFQPLPNRYLHYGNKRCITRGQYSGWERPAKLREGWDLRIIIIGVTVRWNILGEGLKVARVRGLSAIEIWSKSKLGGVED